MVPHVCVFFIGAGLKRNRHDLSEGRTEQVLCICVCSTYRKSDGSRVRSRVLSSLWQRASLELLTALLQEPVRLFIAVAPDASPQHPKTPGGMPPSIPGSWSESGAVSVTHLSHTHAGKNITNLANGLVHHFIEGIKSILGARQFFGNILLGSVYRLTQLLLMDRCSLRVKLKCTINT